MNGFRFRYLSALLALLLLSGFVAACGEDDGETGASTATSAPTTATVGQVVASQPEQTQEPDAAAESNASATSEPDAPATEAPISTEVPASEPTQPAVEQETADDPLPEPDNPAPEIITAGDWYNSEPLALAELRGEPVLLVFWATI